jgi:hypothetical protein
MRDSTFNQICYEGNIQIETPSQTFAPLAYLLQRGTFFPGISDWSFPFTIEPI